MATKTALATKQTKTTTTKSPLKQALTTAKKSLKNMVNDNSNEATLFQAFFLDCLKDIYWAEKALTKTLPKMAKAATTPKLKAAIQDHLRVTETHVTRLDKVFSILREKAQGKKCDAMAGLIEEGKSIISETEAGSATRDVGIILASQKVEHYEIATYGTLVQLARTLGYDKAADLLAKTLEEEKEADVGLTKIAENNVNYDALSE